MMLNMFSYDHFPPYIILVRCMFKCLAHFLAGLFIFWFLSLIVHTFWTAVLYHSFMDHCLVVVKGLA